MRSKLIIFLVLVFLNIELLNAEEYNFDVSKIELFQKGNFIKANKGKVYSNSEGIEIIGKNFIYTKGKDYLEIINGTVFLKKENIKMRFDLLTVDKKNILTATNGIKINDSENLLEIEGETIVFDRKKNILTATNGIKINDSENLLEIEGETIVFDRKKNILKSNKKTTLIDKYKNLFKTQKFEYRFNKQELKIYNASIKDFDDNNFEINFANIDVLTGTLVAENIIINLNNKNFSPENEPRLQGEKVTYSRNITKIKNGKFTTCKKVNNCPPWELTADEITHDKTKKSISYKNVWLNIYDTPLIYFPKFFHPDPTVKRQSGFLMPSFKNSPNNNTFFSIPYFKVINENKDLTFTPRFYAKDQFLIQKEYREVNKNIKFISDLSVLADKKGLESHLFLNLDKEFDTNKYKNNININFEQASNDTYLKANKLGSPIINNYDVLENSIKLNMVSDETTIGTEFIIFENLNKESSDKYEYILPRIELTKNVENKTTLDGNFVFETDNFIHNYNTNIYEKINTNNLIFRSFPKITKRGFNNNFEFVIKNSNTASKKSVINKEGNDNYLSGLFQFNSNYPLFKQTDEYNYILKPKMSLKINPSHTKDLSKNDYKIDVNNIFNLNRISSNETLEGGFSLAYGTDYIVSNKNNNKELLNFKLANNLRLKKNNDLEKSNQLGSKISNFFGEIKFSPLSFLTAKYNVSTLNNLSDINYQNLITNIEFNKFTSTFDYLRQDGDKNSYFLNKTTYDFDKFNQISFSTRENIKTDLTEYYNLMYQYKNDCLAASLEYQKDYYNDRDIKPSESIFFKLTIVPFGSTSTPNLRQ